MKQHEQHGQDDANAMQHMMTSEYLAGDCNFLRDMIVHHKVALAMAKEIYQHTQNPRIMEFSRQIIYN